MASKGRSNFLRLFCDFLAKEFSRVDHVDLDTPLEDMLDESGKVAFVDYLEDRMRPHVLGVSRDAVFVRVTDVASLYEKLCLACKAFPSFIEATPDSSDSEDEPPVQVQEKKKLVTSKKGNVLAALIDAGDDAGDDLLEEQLGLVTAVQISERTHVPGKCIECEDREAVVDCVQCTDEFCAVCYLALHRKGNRSKHETRLKKGHEGVVLTAQNQQQLMKETDDAEGPLDFGTGTALSAEYDTDLDFAFRAQFIPVRLQYKERQLLRLLQAQLSVSTYTDAIDRAELKSNKRVHAQIMKICAFLSGLAVSVNYVEGQRLLASRQWKSQEQFFCTMMELGRRYKVLNPDRMRSEYGRLMYLMMDATRNEVQQLLGFNVRSSMVTVASYLKQRGAEEMLKDPLMEIATRAIDQMTEEGKKTRTDIRSEVKRKEAAVKTLARRYRNSKIDEDDLKWCLYSIGDNRTFLLQHRDPVQRMISYLKRYFGPQLAVVDDAYSLAIYGGVDGSRLTHSHEKQYNYVLQSLTLWREILNDMFRLWCLAEEDMLDPACPYKLEDTGQGQQRIQDSPRVAKAMRDLLFRTQTKLGSWVGSSVVHLGDKNVPNALMFLDKYTQVARILSPICICLDRLPELCEENPKTKSYIDDVFGGIEKTRKDILVDFFKSAFDGSGADNFFDAGSCVDGRTTSAWHWCSQVATKRYYPVLRLSGFSSFDGDWAED